MSTGISTKASTKVSTQGSTKPAIWRMPILLGIPTAVGLIAGLVGDGVWDTAAVLLIGVPTAVGAWYTFRPARAR